MVRSKLNDLVADALEDMRCIKIELKNSIEKEIVKLGITKEQIAEELDILPSGIDIILGQSYWTMEKAMVIIKALNLNTKLEVTQ